jgi:hypothetical protein
MQRATDSLTALLKDSHFRALVEVSSRKALTWEEFLQYPLPSDMSPLQVWDILFELSRCTGIDIHLPGIEDNRPCYHLTHELADLLSTIQCRCGGNSPLARFLLSKEGQHIAMVNGALELQAVLFWEGFSLTTDRLLELVSPEVQPETESERFARALLTLEQQLSSYIDQPFSCDLLEKWQKYLLDQVNFDALCDRRAQGPLPSILLTDSSLAGDPADDQQRNGLSVEARLASVLAYANRRFDQNCDQNFDHSVLCGSLIADAIRLYRPYDPTSAALASLAARLYYLKCGLPVLNALPLTYQRLLWMQGRLASPEEVCSVSDYMTTMRRAPSVLTLYQTLSARFALSSLNELESRAQRDQNRVTALNRMLQDNPKLNYRQRGILLRALQVPFAEFNIRHHQRAHSIAYTTARRDLLSLSECGYLRVVQRGKSFVFFPGAPLNEIGHQESIE